MTVTADVVIKGKASTREFTRTVAITDDRVKVLDEGGYVQDEMGFTVSPAGKTGGIDLASPQSGTFLGLYSLDGDRLRLAYNLSPGGGRPAAVPEPDSARLAGLVVWDLKRVSREPKAASERFANADGCLWMIRPDRPAKTLAGGGLVLLFEADRDGAAFLTLASAADARARAPEYRPVLFDADKKQRYVPEAARGGGSSQGRRDGAVVGLHRWRMDPKILPADKVALVGVEQVPAGARLASARQAVARARGKGIDVLPYPEVGAKYEFDLRTTDGKTVSSRDLRGRVVVIDHWATWCGPCMRLLPEVVALHQKRKADGLAVVGVNLDREWGAAEKACQRLGLDWPQVFVPDDEATRELWQTASGTNAIPLVLLVDRNGVLRAVNPGDLGRQVEELLDEGSGPK